MPTLLHVEDEDAMAVAFRLAVEEAPIPAAIYRVSDGEQALRYLRGAGLYAHAERPDIVFLDLNLPRMDGWQVLMEMRRDENLRSIPVVILSTSARRADQERVKALGAQHYIPKPSTFIGLVSELRAAYEMLTGSA
jgi:CheY-like chemotaxis protein